MVPLNVRQEVFRPHTPDRAYTDYWNTTAYTNKVQTEWTPLPRFGQRAFQWNIAHSDSTNLVR